MDSYKRKHFWQLKMTRSFSKTLIIIIIAISKQLMAQAPPIEWEKTVGGQFRDVAHCLELTPDGGFIVAGTINAYTQQSITEEDLITEKFGRADYSDTWVVKFDKDQKIQWTKTLGTADFFDRPVSIHLTPDGGFLIHALNYEPWWGDESLGYLAKINGQGVLLWQKQYAMGVLSLTPTSDGGFMAITRDYSSGYIEPITKTPIYEGFHLSKLDKDGNILWSKLYSQFKHNYPKLIRKTADEGYILLGLFSESLSVSDAEPWIIKTDSTGEIQWKVMIDSGNDYPFATDIQQTADGGYIFLGEHNDLWKSWLDYWLVKLDDTGKIQWNKQFGGKERELPSRVQQTMDGGYVIAGRSESVDGHISSPKGYFDFWIVKTDDAGNLQWEKSLGGSINEEAHDIRQTDDGGYLIVGYTRSNDGDISYLRNKKAVAYDSFNDYWIVKLKGSCTVSLKVLASSNPTVCEGANGSLSFSTNLPGGTYTFRYKKDNASISTSVNVSGGQFILSGLEAGDYTEFTIIHNGCAGREATTRVLSAPAKPEITAGEITNPVTCGGADGSIRFFTSLPNGDYTINYWRDGNNTSSSVSVNNKILVLGGLSAGTYGDFSVTHNGCTGNDLANKTLSSPANPTLAAGAITNLSTCGGKNGSIRFTTNLPNGSYILNYQADGIPASASVAPDNGVFTLGNLSKGTYTTFIIIHNGCAGSDTASLILTEPKGPTATASNTGPYFGGETVKLSSDGGVSYTWTGPLAFSSDLQNPEIVKATIAHSGIYEVTVIGADNCQSKATTDVKIQAPLAIEPDPGQIRVYPNPAREYVEIEVLHAEKSEATLCSVSGKPLRHVTFSQKAVIKTSDLSPGLYPLIIRTGMKKTVVKVIIH